MTWAFAASLILSAILLHWRWPVLRNERLWFSAVAAAAFVLLLQTWWSVPVAAFLQALVLSHPNYRRALTWLRVPATLAVMTATLVALPAVFLPNNLVNRVGPFAVAFFLGQFADFIARNERTQSISDAIPRRLWIPLVLMSFMGWLHAWAGAAMRTLFALAGVAGVLYLTLDAVTRFDLAGALRAPADAAIETFEAVAILLPFCFACRWVLY